jgi:hypothetical protein
LDAKAVARTEIEGEDHGRLACGLRPTGPCNPAGARSSLVAATRPTEMKMIKDAEIAKTIERLEDEIVRLSNPRRNKKTEALMCMALRQILELLRSDPSSAAGRHPQ